MQRLPSFWHTPWILAAPEQFLEALIRFATCASSCMRSSQVIVLIEHVMAPVRQRTR